MLFYVEVGRGIINNKMPTQLGWLAEIENLCLEFVLRVSEFELNVVQNWLNHFHLIETHSLIAQTIIPKTNWNRTVQMYWSALVTGQLNTEFPLQKHFWCETQHDITTLIAIRLVLRRVNVKHNVSNQYQNCCHYIKQIYLNQTPTHLQCVLLNISTHFRNKSFRFELSIPSNHLSLQNDKTLSFAMSQCVYRPFSVVFFHFTNLSLVLSIVICHMQMRLETAIPTFVCFKLMFSFLRIADSTVKKNIIILIFP